MAKKVNPDLLSGGRGRPPIYPWDEWLDGSTWLLTKGEDFDIQIESMRQSIYNMARRRGGHARVSTTVDGTGVLLRFVEGGSDA